MTAEQTETVELELVGDTIADALARAQATFEVPKKSRTVRVQTRESGTYTYSYAELPDVIAAVEPSLTRERIALTQDATTDLGRQTVRVVTLLRYGRETLSFGPLELPIARLDVQGIGSAITYGRRYQLTTALGIAAEPDDDGAAAAGNEPQEPGERPERATPAPRGRAVSRARMARLHAIAKTKGLTHQNLTDWAGRHLGIETLAELDTKGANELEKAMIELPDVENDADATVEGGGTAPAPGSDPRVASSPDDAGPAGDGSDALAQSDGGAGGTAS